MASSENPITNIILLSHGSPDPRSAVRMEEFADAISNRLGIATHSAYLDHNSPSLQDVAATIRDPDALVVPMLLTTAFHAR
ncbi:MAG TPA: CbiX/SirB N-terminal domain-containing protein, partial [Candidatus Nanopelagicaceae bacterium]